MATSNVQLQQIMTQLAQAGGAPPGGIQSLNDRIATLKTQISTMDKTDAFAYSMSLQQLYSMQSMASTSNTAAIQSLIQQKIALLEILTQQ